MRATIFVERATLLERVNNEISKVFSKKLFYNNNLDSFILYITVNDV